MKQTNPILLKKIEGIEEGKIYEDEETLTIRIETEPKPVDNLKVNDEKLGLGILDSLYKKDIQLKEGENLIKIEIEHQGEKQEKIYKLNVDLTKKRERISKMSMPERIKEFVLDNNDEYEVRSGDEKETLITVIRKPETSWDETSLVRGAIDNFKDIGKKVFEYDNSIKTFTFIQDAEFTDAYGNTEVETAYALSMSRESFNKFNWDNLTQNSYYAIKTEGIETMHPAIRKEYNPDDIF